MTAIPAIRSIATPSDLTSLIGEIKAAVAAGVLKQVRPDPSPFATDEEIVNVPEHGPWPDLIEMRFEVLGTAVRYKLSVETFHGAGGTWAPD